MSRSSYVNLYIIPIIAAVTPRLAMVDRTRIVHAQKLATFMGADIDAAVAPQAKPAHSEFQAGSEFDVLFCVVAINTPSTSKP